MYQEINFIVKSLGLLTQVNQGSSLFLLLSLCRNSHLQFLGLRYALRGFEYFKKRFRNVFCPMLIPSVFLSLTTDEGLSFLLEMGFPPNPKAEPISVLRQTSFCIIPRSWHAPLVQVLARLKGATVRQAHW